MSDKKQSSVEWLVEKIQQANPSFKFDALIRQAKAMHKEEIVNAYLTCYQEYTAEGKHWEMGMNPKETFKEYYNETYGDE